MAVTVVWAVTGLGWSRLFPPYQAPDELMHIDMVLQVADDVSYPRDRFAVSDDTTAMASWIHGHTESEGYTTDVPGRGDRPSLDDLPAAEVPLPNQMFQHPPAYYGVSAVGYRAVEPAVSDLELIGQLGALRIISILFGLPIPWFIALTVQRLGGSDAAAVGASLLPLAVPQFSATLGSVNNDIPLVTAGAVAAWAVARLLTDADDRRAAFWLGGALAFAMLTKGLGLPMLVVLVTGLLVAAPARARLSLIAWSAGIALVGGGWWWAWNQARFGTLQPGGLGLRERVPSPGYAADPWGWFRNFAPWIVHRSWGWFASFDRNIRISPVVVAVASTASLVLVGTGIRAGGSAVKRFALVTALLVLGSLAVIMYGSYGVYARHRMLTGIQGRYLFAALPAMCVLAALGLQRIVPRWSAVRVAAVLVLLMQVIGAWVMLDGMWGGPSASLGESLRAAAAWSPWPPALLVTAALGGAAALAWLVTRGDAADASAEGEPLPALSG